VQTVDGPCRIVNLADGSRTLAAVWFKSSGNTIRSSRPFVAESWALPGNIRSMHGCELAITWRFRR